MSFSKVLVVFRKEMLDLLRDKRTIFSSIVLPIILYPILMIGFNSLMSRQTIKLEEQEVIVYVLDNVENENSYFFLENLRETKGIQIYQQTEAYQMLFDEKILQAIITLDEEPLDNEYEQLKVTITYSAVDEKSELAYNQTTKFIRGLREQLVGKRLQAINISENVLKVIEVVDDDIATGEQTLGLILSKILPYFLIIISISGAATAAVDLVAGEKERKTLETILVSAAKRNELVFGKFLSVITISIVTVVLNLLSIFFSFRHIMSQAALDTVPISIPIGNILLIMSIMLPMIILFGSVIFSLSTYSRNMKECYSYTQPIMIVAMLLSLIAALPAFETTFGLTLIPVINVSLLTKDIMLGDLNIYHYLATLLSTCILVAIAIFISIRLFNKEGVLFRTVEEGSIVKDKKGRFNPLNPSFAFLFFLFIVLLFYYLAISWQTENLEVGLIKTLLLLVLLPTILVIKFGKLSLKETLSIRWTNPLNYLLVLLISVPFFVIVTHIAQLINFIYPFPESYLEMFQNMVLFEGKGAWYTFFIVALLPGIAEEVMFRGYFIQAFKSKNIWISIVVSAVLFSLLHLDIFRFIPVALLGIWLGYLLVKTKSIFAPMLAHIAHNGLALVVSNIGDKIPFFELMVKDDNLAWWTILPALALAYVLVILFNKLNKGSEEFATERVVER
ncbi:MAG: ABC transporter permease subunit/CPBP intramembrane protease [Candidatus Cloacimonas sp.]|nr:CPBP family intramembrane metalloprotease [Candidatus Cloacimonadota bacterium]